MATYTADPVALLLYPVESLPPRADQILAEAEAGETLIRAPSTALVEVLYAVSRDKDVRGVTLTGTPAETRQALVGEGAISLASVEDAELVEYAKLVDEFSIHDGLIVASHRAQEADAIITSDEGIRASKVETVWDRLSSARPTA